MGQAKVSRIGSAAHTGNKISYMYTHYPSSLASGHPRKRSVGKSM